jgi:hypothetical protein
MGRGPPARRRRSLSTQPHVEPHAAVAVGEQGGDGGAQLDDVARQAPRRGVAGARVEPRLLAGAVLGDGEHRRRRAGAGQGAGAAAPARRRGRAREPVGRTCSASAVTTSQPAASARRRAACPAGRGGRERRRVGEHARLDAEGGGRRALPAGAGGVAEQAEDGAAGDGARPAAARPAGAAGWSATGRATTAWRAWAPGRGGTPENDAGATGHDSCVVVVSPDRRAPGAPSPADRERGRARRHRAPS